MTCDAERHPSTPPQMLAAGQETSGAVGAAVNVTGHSAACGTALRRASAAALTFRHFVECGMLARTWLCRAATMSLSGASASEWDHMLSPPGLFRRASAHRRFARYNARDSYRLSYGSSLSFLTSPPGPPPPSVPTVSGAIVHMAQKLGHPASCRRRAAALPDRDHHESVVCAVRVVA
jgi:hypothetical protein